MQKERATTLYVDVRGSPRPWPRDWVMPYDLLSRCEQSVQRGCRRRCSHWEHLLLRRANHRAWRYDDATWNRRETDAGYQHRRDSTSASRQSCAPPRMTPRPFLIARSFARRKESNEASTNATVIDIRPAEEKGQRNGGRTGEAIRAC